MHFSELPIPEAVMAGVHACGFTECTPIQAQTLPLSLAGRDVAGQAQTGTGKTAAFLIAAFSRLIRSQEAGHTVTHDSVSHPRVLIIAPTRELAVQIENDARRLAVGLDLVIAAVYGGVDYEKQRLTLVEGRVDILIGTPGRLIDYFKQKAYRVSAVEVLVIDEADRMFDMGFIEDLRYLLRRLPPYDRRQSLLFSATLSYRAQELSYEYMDSPEVISTTVDSRAVEQVTQTLYHVEGRRKISLLVGLLRRDLADDSGAQTGRAMVFVNTKRMGERLKEWLRGNGIHAGYLSGDVPQAKRLHTLQRFQEGLVPVLIATDVAGRGLHIEGVTHVVNFDLPENPEDYVHRIGRTARAGATGDAISLVDEDGAYHLEAIFAYLGAEIPSTWPENELFVHLTRPAPPAPGPEGEPTGPASTSGRRRTRSGRPGPGEKRTPGAARVTRAGTDASKAGTAPAEAGTNASKAGTAPAEAGTDASRAGTAPAEAGTNASKAGTAPAEAGTDASKADDTGSNVAAGGEAGDVATSEAARKRRRRRRKPAGGSAPAADGSDTAGGSDPSA
ncbi:ATP-dependent RNA helicase RhlB [Candidatus Magnetaquicoccaceae bacterium FCR-1]|uniref:ATP-dependent RNA helicase RhlB n=1 Tax=Candidatus Magnetaquiglobus chichijimensis TaxID=3141448 RepID=A0ABQ0CCP2_9PROT